MIFSIKPYPIPIMIVAKGKRAEILTLWGGPTRAQGSVAARSPMRTTRKMGSDFPFLALINNTTIPPTKNGKRKMENTP
jgi:hypothetical protein